VRASFDVHLPEPPEEFVSLLAAEGESGRRWLEALPETIDRLTRAWNVEVERWLPGGRSSCVLLGRRAGRAVVLKLPVRRSDFARERAALGGWDGRGAVAVLAADDEHGALLLPFLGGRTLAELSEDEALALAAPVLVAVHEAEPGDAHLSTSLERHEAWSALVDRLWAERTDEPPVSTAQRERAERLARELWADLAPAEHRILHGDLGPLNVLLPDDGEPVAIDPFGQIGDPATDVADLALRAPGPPETVTRRVTRLAELTGRSRERVHAHAYVRGVMGVLFLAGMDADGLEAQLAYLEDAGAE
jgi:streptomycin 6-kinase